jgi:hypothetical protein
MTWENDQQLVTWLARQVVRHAAPDELPLFDATSDTFFAAPKRVRRAAGRDEPLGFGLETAFTVISTLALTVTVDVLKQLATRSAQQMVDKATPKASAILRKWRRRRSSRSVEPLPHFNEEQLAELRELAYRRALQLKASEEQATLIADGIANALVSRSAADN